MCISCYVLETYDSKYPKKFLGIRSLRVKGLNCNEILNNILLLLFPIILQQTSSSQD